MRNPRYALVSGLYAVALCKDVDGLYGDPVPPPRAVHELRGCEARGDLARAVTQAVVEGSAPFGTLHVQTHDGLAWLFDEVRVLGARGDVVTVESSGGPRRAHGTHGAFACGNLIRVSPPAPPERTHTEVTFRGCSPRGELREALAGGAEEFDAVRYQVLTWTGSVHHEGDAGRVTGWDGSRLGHGLVDLAVSFPRQGLIPHQSRQVWDLWHRDRPAEPGTWRRFTGAARAEWLNQAAGRSYGAPDITPGTTYHLDGTDVTDEDSLLCALGETFYGPGRSFGVGAPRAVAERLAGTTLVWHDADVARRCLGVLPYADRRPATFQEFVDAFRSAGVRLVLD
ncbi:MULTISPECIES: hypothetical protein [Streptomyces]|uniref:Barstar (barnase inhibitor) domain-containing protein n=1 Tax=Streptomyces venezuelae (strain ATCC 10712 / CBS 650.69 / DSM 40230 / JCM 4526 / NBRC 13096 / PD 04745) TaxID=953739 RepID=F2RIQ1_STRVP|nr:hypothetical protein [Streptomyces venezuelae]APE23302.1 hypothetical protein vnz_21330 [Streptomyces venezuelae]QES00680.1 hypothetical protein DEJ43_21640 [Streptomyces venezuelae ATCC 10712]CCA57607.1 hypothetical protein SVEN_4321 [Streptomyces venezuelae ATCC 10712]